MTESCNKMIRSRYDIADMVSLKDLSVHDAWHELTAWLLGKNLRRRRLVRKVFAALGPRAVRELTILLQCYPTHPEVPLRVLEALAEMDLTPTPELTVALEIAAMFGTPEVQLQATALSAKVWKSQDAATGSSPSPAPFTPADPGLPRFDGERFRLGGVLT